MNYKSNKRSTMLEDLLKVTLYCVYQGIPIWAVSGGFKALGRFTPTLLGAKSIVDMSIESLKNSLHYGRK